MENAPVDNSGPAPAGISELGDVSAVEPDLERRKELLSLLRGLTGARTVGLSIG